MSDRESGSDRENAGETMEIERQTWETGAMRERYERERERGTSGPRATSDRVRHEL